MLGTDADDFVPTDRRLEDTEQECLHELLEEQRPPNQKGEAHMLACPCPKCSPRC